MQVSILGCGWLGLPLAKRLCAGGFTVKGSTTTEARIAVLKESGVKPYLVSLMTEKVSGNVNDLLHGSDILVIDIPPKAKEGSFRERIRQLLPYIEQSGITKVLFVSSTSVYADGSSVITEDTLPNPDTESGRQLLEAEKLLQGSTRIKTTILRFAGLIGADRHPVYHLAGRKALPSPDAPVNLIHREDCIGIIKAIIEKNAWGEVFNGVAPYHPSRKEYYTAKANELGLTLPEFETSEIASGKMITSIKVGNVLSYNGFTLL